MYDAPQAGPAPPGDPTRPYPGWPVSPTVPGPHRGRVPSGLFPSTQSRPVYREVLPARPGAVLAGAGASTAWMMLFGLIAHTARGYCWWTISGGLVAWLTAIVLARAGDRGVAAGVAMAAGCGVTIAMSVVLVRWIGGHWLLW